jgi:uncharacterized protein YuzE
MRITYDKMADAAYIQLMEVDNRRGIVEYSERIKGGEIRVHFTKEGKIFGIEILDASELLPQEFLKLTPRIDKEDKIKATA